MSSLQFFDQLLNLRLSASLLYDRGKRSGQGDEELHKTLEPLRAALDGLIAWGMANDLAGVLCAIKRLETEAKAHDADAKLLILKSVNTKEHVERLEDELKKIMKAKGQDFLNAGDFSVTLTVDHGKEILTIR